MRTICGRDPFSPRFHRQELSKPSPADKQKRCGSGDLHSDVDSYQKLGWSGSRCCQGIDRQPGPVGWIPGRGIFMRRGVLFFKSSEQRGLCGCRGSAASKFKSSWRIRPMKAKSHSQIVARPSARSGSGQAMGPPSTQAKACATSACATSACAGSMRHEGGYAEDSRVSVHYMIRRGIRRRREAIPQIGRGGVEEILRRQSQQPVNGFQQAGKAGVYV
jgi:hypothetical protein